MYENCDIQIIEQPTYILRQMLEADQLDLILDISSPDTINFESELLVKESFVLAIPDSLCPFSDPPAHLSSSAALVSDSQAESVSETSNRNFFRNIVKSKKEEGISATPQIHLPALSAVPFILLSEDHDLGKISPQDLRDCRFPSEYPLHLHQHVILPFLLQDEDGDCLSS